MTVMAIVMINGDMAMDITPAGDVVSHVYAADPTGGRFRNDADHTD